MNEFIKKLIERFLSNCVIYAENYEKAVNIANQLAEEYEPCHKPCTDCEEYDLVRNHCPKFCKVIKETVEEIEENHSGWIPCSERLPNKEEYLKNDGRFIVTDGCRRYQSIYDIYQGRFRTLKIKISGWVFEEDNCVIAWQPLPTPYQPENS